MCAVSNLSASASKVLPDTLQLYSVNSNWLDFLIADLGVLNYVFIKIILLWGKGSGETVT